MKKNPAQFRFIFHSSKILKRKISALILRNYEHMEMSVHGVVGGMPIRSYGSSVRGDPEWTDTISTVDCVRYHQNVPGPQHYCYGVAVAVRSVERVYVSSSRTLEGKRASSGRCMQLSPRAMDGYALYYIILDNYRHGVDSRRARARQ